MNRDRFSLDSTDVTGGTSSPDTSNTRPHVTSTQARASQEETEWRERNTIKEGRRGLNDNTPHSRQPRCSYPAPPGLGIERF